MVGIFGFLRYSSLEKTKPWILKSNLWFSVIFWSWEMQEKKASKSGTFFTSSFQQSSVYDLQPTSSSFCSDINKRSSIECFLVKNNKKSINHNEIWRAEKSLHVSYNRLQTKSVQEKSSLIFTQPISLQK